MAKDQVSVKGSYSLEPHNNGQFYEEGYLIRFPETEFFSLSPRNALSFGAIVHQGGFRPADLIIELQTNPRDGFPTDIWVKSIRIGHYEEIVTGGDIPIETFASFKHSPITFRAARVGQIIQCKLENYSNIVQSVRVRMPGVAVIVIA